MIYKHALATQTGTFIFSGFIGRESGPKNGSGANLKSWLFGVNG
jgi:hypothetical protein